MKLRPAGARDAPTLTAIAHAAKRHWGYPEAWIHAWRETLTITPVYLAANAAWIAEDDGGLGVGFAALREERGEPWIDHVWVMPAAMGRGVGRALFATCEAEARRRGARRLMVEADPHAEAFYVRMGMHTIDRVAAPMDGTERWLPIMEKLLG